MLLDKNKVVYFNLGGVCRGILSKLDVNSGKKCSGKSDLFVDWFKSTCFDRNSGKNVYFSKKLSGN